MKGFTIVLITGVLVSTVPVRAQTLPSTPPSKAAEHVKAGNDLADQGKYDRAKVEYERAIALAPESYEAYYELGLLNRSLKNYQESRRQLGIAIAKKPDCWFCYDALGAIADEQGHPEEALKLFAKASEIAPKRGKPHYSSAVTHSNRSNLEAAIAALKKAEELEPAYASPFFLLGNIYFQQQKYYLAFDQLFQATKLETKGPRYDAAKKIINANLTMDDSLGEGRMAQHFAYCLSRAAATTAEGYRERHPGAETYVENLEEEVYVLGQWATILVEMSEDKPLDPDFTDLVRVHKSGFLKPFVLSYASDRFAEDARVFEQQAPGKMAEFRKWAGQNAIVARRPVARCEYEWMGRKW